jgi:hypothetical protein
MLCVIEQFVPIAIASILDDSLSVVLVTAECLKEKRSHHQLQIHIWIKRYPFLIAPSVFLIVYLLYNV